MYTNVIWTLIDLVKKLNRKRKNLFRVWEALSSNKIKGNGATTCVLAFKLQDASDLPHRDRQLLLTGVDDTTKNTMYDQMKTSLKSSMVIK